MKFEFAGATCVVTAQHFNPSVIRESWLLKHGILVEEDLLPGFAFTDMLANINTAKVHMLIAPDRVQFTPKVDIAEQQALLNDKLGTIIGILPHTPYQAIGLNFEWHARPEDGDIHTLCRELFFRTGRPIDSEFDSQDARLGAYFSKDFHAFRMKLDIKPMAISAEADGETNKFEILRFGFNFHRDVQDSADMVSDLKESIGFWDEARMAAEAITNRVREATTV